MTNNHNDKFPIKTAMLIADKENYVVYCSSLTYGNEHDFARLLDELNFKNNFLFVISKYEVFDINKVKNTIDANDKNLINLIKKYKKSAENKNYKFKILFEHKDEAPTYKYDYKFIIDYIIEKTNISLKDIIIFSGAQHQFNTSIINCATNRVAIRNFKMEELAAYNCHVVPTHHFVSLARIARPHRIETTVQLLDKKLDKFGHISLGSGYYNVKEENNFSAVPQRYQHLMPMYIDGPQENHNGNENIFNSIKITHAFANIVQESSYEKEINLNYWSVPFITEKSTKPFALGQVPIYICYHNSLKYIRAMGFDLFDDIIDHSYDLEINPLHRIKLAVEQLEKICNKSIQYWQEYKAQNIDRFIHNQEKLKYYTKNIYEIQAQDLQNAIDK